MHSHFSINVVGTSWDSTFPEEIPTITTEESQAIIRETRSWYEGLSDLAKCYVTGVTVRPSRRHNVHVDLETSLLEIRVPRGAIRIQADGFIYDLETRTVGAGKKPKLSLSQALNQTLTVFLARSKSASITLSNEMVRVLNSLTSTTR